MEHLKLIILLSYVVIATCIAILIINLLTLRIKQKSIIDGKIGLSYGIWFVSLFLSLSVLLYASFEQLQTAIDMLMISPTQNFWTPILRMSSLHLGFAVLVFIIWYYVIGLLATVILGNRKDKFEAEGDNYVYFLIKGTLLFCSIWLLVFPLRTVLTYFLPSVELPLFH